MFSSNSLIKMAMVTLAVVSVAGDVQARASGHPGATGRDNAGGRCNRCHSPDTYDGAEIILDEEYRRDCYEKVSGAWTLQSSHWVIPYGAEVNVHLVAPTPPAGTPDNPDTPVDEGVPGLFCPAGSTCGASVAGFAMEVEGAQVFADGSPSLIGDTADGQKQATTEGVAGPELSAIEVNHASPKALADGEVSWTMKFKSPVVYTGVNPQNQVRFWAGVNVCNGNGGADQGDITSYTNTYVYFDRGNGQSTAPTMDCTVVEACTGGMVRNSDDLSCECPEGQELTDTDTCVEAAGCGCRTTNDDSAAPAVFVLALMATVARRRRSPRC